MNCFVLITSAKTEVRVAGHDARVFKEGVEEWDALDGHHIEDEVTGVGEEKYFGMGCGIVGMRFEKGDE